jgi:hypothetical protein
MDSVTKHKNSLLLLPTNETKKNEEMMEQLSTPCTILVWPCDCDTFDGFSISIGADAMTLKIFQQSRSQVG